MMKMTEGYVCLDNVRCYAHHGVMPQETTVGAMFSVNIRAKYPFDKALHSDHVDDTLNYAAIYDIIKEEMKIPSKLIEHVAGRIGETIFRKFPLVESIDISIAKANPPMGADLTSASVELHLINDKTI